MTDHQSTAKGVAFKAADHVAYIDGAVVSKTLIKKEIGTVTLFAFEAGQGLSEHTAPFDALVQILDGEALITIGGEPQTVTTGEMIIMPANVPHEAEALEDTLDVDVFCPPRQDWLDGTDSYFHRSPEK